MNRDDESRRSNPFELRDAARAPRPITPEDDFTSSQLLSDASRAGVRFAVPKLSQNGSEGLVGGSSFMGGSFVSQSSGMGMHGAGGGMHGRRSATDAGSMLLQSLGDSLGGGSLGSTLHTLSSLTNSRNGYALSTTGTGVDFHVSGSMGNLMSAPMSGTGQAAGANGLGSHGQGGRGPSLSLKLKF
jgi:hypothetical protein